MQSYELSLPFPVSQVGSGIVHKVNFRVVICSKYLSCLAHGKGKSGRKHLGFSFEHGVIGMFQVNK